MDFVSSTFDFVPFRIYAIMAVVREHSRYFFFYEVEYKQINTIMKKKSQNLSFTK